MLYALPPELRRLCMEYIPCFGVSSDILSSVKLTPLSEHRALFHQIRPYCGKTYKYTYAENNTIHQCVFTICNAEAFRFNLHYMSPIQRTWYVMSSKYIGDGEYDCLCVSDTGSHLCRLWCGNVVAIYPFDIFKFR